MISLLNSYKYFDESIPEHVEAMTILEDLVKREYPQLLDDEQEWVKKFRSHRRNLTEEDIKKLGEEFQLDPRIIKAIIKVECNGKGFLKNGKPVILFESHIFGYETGYRYNNSHPHISTKKWDSSLYKGGEEEWRRFEEARRLDERAACMSISMGLGQVMGFNYQMAGYKTVEEFFKDMHTSEYRQARAMLKFCESSGALEKARKLDWAGFAYIYNGEGYRANNYDVKLREAYHSL